MSIGPHAASPLEGSTTKIRLVELLPGTEDEEEEVQCLFRVYPVAECPEFTALSYAWGPKTPIHRILVDDRPLWVRENLWQALRMLRFDVSMPSSAMLNTTTPSRRRRWLNKAHSRSITSDLISTQASSGSATTYQSQLYWIDQICVNQDDISERNHQVGLMKDIYSRAAKVLVWLGGSENIENEAAAADFFRRREMDYSYMLAGAPSGVLNICNRSYWKRMWVVQEIMLAQHVEIRVGIESFLFDDLIWGVDYETRVWSTGDKKTIHLNLGGDEYRRALQQSGARKLVWTKDVLKMHHAERQQVTLRMLITLCSEQECSDIRDKIFGLFSLLTQTRETEDVFHADYSTTSWEVYSLALQIAGAQESLDVFQLLDFCVQCRKVLDLNPLQAISVGTKTAISHFHLCDQKLIDFCLRLQTMLEWQPTVDEYDFLANEISAEVKMHTGLMTKQILIRPALWFEIFKCASKQEPNSQLPEQIPAIVYNPSLLISKTWKRPRLGHLEPILAQLRRYLHNIQPRSTLQLATSTEFLQMKQWADATPEPSHFHPSLNKTAGKVSQKLLQEFLNFLKPFLRRVDALEISFGIDRSLLAAKHKEIRSVIKEMIEAASGEIDARNPSEQACSEGPEFSYTGSASYWQDFI
jgi:hypothetical protein